MRITSEADITRLDFERAGGLLPVVAQHAATGEVLMLAYADAEALRRTIKDGRMWYYSRSRSEYWRKGETSGNELRVESLHADCDADAVLALVLPAGPACHTGARSCFGAAPTLLDLSDVISARASSDPVQDGSYTVKLLSDKNLRLKKLGEESIELALACADEDGERAAEEAADVVYHTLVACRAVGVGLDDVLEVLRRRAAARGS
jgi:phosphoribosyl-ATP pyrophosphohydrolase/phosphoribosyl-AMP cyclohydrolase